MLFRVLAIIICDICDKVSDDRVHYGINMFVLPKLLVLFIDTIRSKNTFIVKDK